MDWPNIFRTLAQIAIVAVGIVLPLLTAAFWKGVGIDNTAVSGVLGTAAVAFAAWWRQRFQTAFESKR